MPNQGITGVIGSDILSINGVVLSGHADGEAYKLEPLGPLSEYKISKDGNTIVALKFNGLAAKLTVRLVRGCADDLMLNGLLAQFIGSPSSFSLLDAEYIKSIGDGKGSVVNEVNVLSAGAFDMFPGAVTNMDGSIDSGVVTYTMIFRLDGRLPT